MTPQLSLVVPTRDRLDFVRRVLRYYAQVGLDSPILIADSSGRYQDQVPAVAKEFAEQLDVQVSVSPPEISLIDKIRHALSVVKTPFAVLGADDDFFIPAALHRAVEFLSANPSYTVAHGHAICFGTQSTAAFGPIRSVWAYDQRSIEHERAVDRLLDHFGNLTATFYSVSATELLVETFSLPELAALRGTTTFMELMLSGRMVALGKAKKLDRLYWVRQIGVAKSYSAQTFQEWLLAPWWSHDANLLVEALALAVARADAIDLAAARVAVQRALFAYLSLRFARARPPSRQATLRRQLLRVLRGASRRVLPATLGQRVGGPSLRTVLDPASPYYPGFRSVYDLVTGAP